MTLCRTCGHRHPLPELHAWLVEHRAQRRLQCHHCGHAEGPPGRMSECGTRDSLTAVGPGVERVRRRRTTLWPGRTAAWSWPPTPCRGRPAAAEAARAIQDREVDLIIGTQIVAKGWHFPYLFPGRRGGSRSWAWRVAI
jgi:primosomal protein N' (replication factor Y)